METTIKLNLALVVPEIDKLPGAQSLDQLQDSLQKRKGILRAHIEHDRDPLELCLHYDPNLISLAAVQRMALEAGSELSSPYRHEQIPLAGMTTADAAIGLAESLAKQSGVLHASVNYAAGLLFVDYDAEKIDRAAIEKQLKKLGYRVATETALRTAPAEEEHDHGSAPSFLPHGLQERWTYLLVASAGIFLLAGYLGESYFGLHEKIALVLFVLSYVAGGYDVATHAIPALFKGKFDTDILMLAAATGAALLGDWVEGAFLLFLFSLGHAGEHYALDHARNAVNALAELMPKTARVRRGERIVEEPVEALAVDDVVIVRPGDRVPVDGIVERGSSAIDQSPITGESVPVTKTIGDEVFAGTINLEAAFDVRITRLAKDNTLNRVMSMVADAQSQKSPTQQFTQRFTSIFVPAILVLVALVIGVSPLLGWMPLEKSFYVGMLLLVASSPCALALGTPATVLSGIAQAARKGVLIKGGVHLENLGRVRVMAFDKTGTLTRGEFEVTDIVAAAEIDPDELLRVAAGVEQQSNHPLALAVVAFAKEKRLKLPQVGGLENVAGRGVKSEIDGKAVLIGTIELFRESEGHVRDRQIEETVDRLQEEGKTTMAVSVDGRFLGVLALADSARPAVRDTLQKLLDLGVEKLVMLTGDNDKVARRIARQVGVTDVQAELMPVDKLKTIERLEKEYGFVAMIGDGVNDAPALATATVGIAMGGAGTAVALETADVALMADDLSKLPFAVGLSRASRRIIQQNLVFSMGVIAVLVAAALSQTLALSGAVIVHEGSTIVVVLNALRLLRYREFSG